MRKHGGALLDHTTQRAVSFSDLYKSTIDIGIS